jgi:hypothetical protein
VAASVPRLRVIGQVVLWIARLVGERISEIYGLHVCAYVPDKDDRPSAGDQQARRDPRWAAIPDSSLRVWGSGDVIAKALDV